MRRAMVVLVLAAGLALVGCPSQRPDRAGPAASASPSADQHRVRGPAADRLRAAVGQGEGLAEGRRWLMIRREVLVVALDTTLVATTDLAADLTVTGPGGRLPITGVANGAGSGVAGCEVQVRRHGELCGQTGPVFAPRRLQRLMVRQDDPGQAVAHATCKSLYAP